ncbi:MAG: AtpZ/AtpI family protein [bacterium]|nr:AtpZ/AtpI family protein [bacterium]
MEKPKRSVWVQVGRYTSLAFVLPTCVVVGYMIGYLLDQAFETTFLMPIFLLLGIAAGFIELVREVQKDTGE